MTNRRSQLLTLLILSLGAIGAHAGTLFYVPIPAPGSDTNSGISAEYGYTSAVDGGNTSGTHRVVNEITLDAMPGSGQSVTADNCTITALSGTLTNGNGAGGIPADGVIAGALSDLIFNHGAGDDSQQEIVLDPASLTPGMTYDLRVYIYNGGGQNRQVNLAFVGDDLPAAETGFFNQDDARTSAGGFPDAKQVYYINYRYTWDGESTPGITITQKSGNAPFCFYALTNQEVPGTAAAATASTAAGQTSGGEGSAGGDEGEGEEEGLTTGMVTAESDQVGVTSDTFYGAESLTSNGSWVNVSSYGKCWRPTRVSSSWRPYTDGCWRYADDCGWTWVSEEPWAWATYHYGRWVNVSDYGWCWTPGTTWSGGWVSWRRGSSRECGTCVGWAPLPPEATCDINVGISTWVDNTCDIGPSAWTFINVRDFGATSYVNCGGCITDRGTYINIVQNTTNITNICYSNTYVNVYNGGPDYDWCNTEIKKQGGKQCDKIYVNKYDDIGKMSKHEKKLAKLEGNQYSLAAPKVKGQKNPKHSPKVADNFGADKVDKGWKGVKDKNLQMGLKQKMAQEAKGKNPANTKAQLPDDVAQKMGKGQKGLAGADSKMGKGQKGMGKGQKALGGPDTSGGQIGQQAAAAGGGQQIGKKGKGKRALPPMGGASLTDEGTGATGGGGGQTQPGLAGQTGGGRGKGLKPGKKLKGAGGQMPGAGQADSDAAGGQQGVAGQTGGGLRPGKKGKKGSQGIPPQVGGAGATDATDQSHGGTGEQLGGGTDLRPGKKGKGKRGATALGQQGQTGQTGEQGQIGPQGEQQSGGTDLRPGKKGKGKRGAGVLDQQGQTGQTGEQGQIGPQGEQQSGGTDLRPGKKGKGKRGAAALGQQGQTGQTGEQGQIGPQTGDQQLGGPDTRPGKKGKGRRGALGSQGQEEVGPTMGSAVQPDQTITQPGRGKGKKGKGQQAMQQQQPQGFSQPQDQTQSSGQTGGGGGKRGGKGGRKQQQAQQQPQPQGFQQPQDQTQQLGQTGGGGGGKRGGRGGGGRKQQQAQQQQQQVQPQQQQVQPQQQAQQQYGQAGGGGGKRGGGGGGRRKQQQAQPLQQQPQQQVQPQQQQVQPQPQQQGRGGGGGGGKKRRGQQPTPTPGYGY